MTPWAWGDRKTFRLGAVLTGALGGNAMTCFQVLAQRLPYPFGDLFALWTYAKIAVAGRAAELYDMGQMYAAEIALGLPTAEVLGVHPSTLAPFPYPYPPTFLFILWPLGWLSFGAAAILWISLTFVLYACAVCIGTRRWALVLFGLVIAPTTIVNIDFGQSGFLLAALLLGGLRIMDRRPVLAGILFGIMSYKPQFAMLLPVVFLATGQWRCMAVAGVTVAVQAAAATVAFGSSIWMIWLRSLPAYTNWFDSLAHYLFLRSSIRDDLRQFGVHPDIVLLVQGVAIVAAVAAVWVAMRRGPRDLARIVVVAATCMAAPHSVIYDFPMLTAAAFLFAERRLRMTAQFGPLEMAILLLVLLFPAALTWSAPLPFAAVLPILFLGMVLAARRAEMHPGTQPAWYPVIGSNAAT